MLNYVLGLDLGNASIGWAIIEIDQSGKLVRIVALGVRAFKIPEDNGKLSSLKRREARSKRTTLRHRKRRLQAIIDVFIQHKLLCDEDIERLKTPPQDASPWQLRSEGLDRCLEPIEFARVLYHIAKHRGFKSNCKADGVSKEPDRQKIKSAIGQNRKAIQELGYRTAGEMMFKNEAYQVRKRNAPGEYTQSIDRVMNEAEIERLFEAQRTAGNLLSTPEFEIDCIKQFAYQKPFANRKLIEKMVGYCSIEGNEKRAPTNSYSFERFRLFESLNKLAWFDNGEKHKLTANQRKVVESEALRKSSLTFEDVRIALGLPSNIWFNNHDKTGKRKFCDMRGLFAIKKLAVVANIWDELWGDVDKLDQIADSLTYCKDDLELRAELIALNLPTAFIEQAVASPGFTQFSHISIKALRKLLPHVEAGLSYSEAKGLIVGTAENGKTNHAKSLLLPEIPADDYRNPTVVRALTQCRKVVNAIIKRYGSPFQINIEMARDIAKDALDRKKISDEQLDNEKRNEARAAKFEELFGRHHNSGDELFKLRLYDEQCGICIYSGQAIDPNRLLEDGYLEVDHILPRSRSWDDSLSNKVLVLKSANQNKQNFTPHERFGSDSERWASFVARAGFITDRRKREKLLKQNYQLEPDKVVWLPRNLTDTQSITRSFAGFLRSNLIFANEGNKMPVVCLNGRITASLRGVWGLTKDRKTNDLHHAKDAAVIASVTPRTIQTLTRHIQMRERTPWKRGENYVEPSTGELIDYSDSYPQPWKGFRDELLARLAINPATEIAGLNLTTYTPSEVDSLKRVFVSRMPQRKLSGAMHKDTFYSSRVIDESGKYRLIRKPLTDLSLSTLDDKFNYPGSNRRLYEAIKSRLIDCGGDAKKAFDKSNPLYTPVNPGNGNDQTIVRRVKVREAVSGIAVRGGIVKHDKMARVDVYAKDGQYYLVPIYVSHIMLRQVPNKAIVQHKLENEWDTIDDSFEFKFSLQYFDLIEIVSNSVSIKGYYQHTDRDTGKLTVSYPNEPNSRKDERPSTKTANIFRKLEINVLGDIHEARREKPYGLENRGDLESGEAED